MTPVAMCTGDHQVTEQLREYLVHIRMQMRPCLGISTAHSASLCLRGAAAVAGPSATRLRLPPHLGCRRRGAPGRLTRWSAVRAHKAGRQVACAGFPATLVGVCIMHCCPFFVCCGAAFVHCWECRLRHMRAHALLRACLAQVGTSSEHSAAYACRTRL